MYRINITIILCLTLFFNLLFLPKQANAWVTATTAGVAVDAGANIGGTSGIFANFGKDVAKWALESVNAVIVTAAKVAALLTVQQVTKAIIGSGGGSGVISDWNNYLYVSPQQRAMVQMNSFFNTVSRGRLSSLNYEGIGPNYDAYLVAQARQAIMGQPFATNLQDIVTDPTQMFASGNMKGIMTYMACPNNPACYTLTSTDQYNIEFAKAQEIARNEQDKGFLPVRKGGKIIQPASLVSSAFSQIDQLGTQVIMNAAADGKTAAIIQIAQGTGISILARTANYATASDEGRAAIRNKNDQFPFSLAYSANGGLGISAGGLTASTGAGALSGAMNIGNTCASGNFTIDSGGATIDINGTKIPGGCPAGSQPRATGTPPSINGVLPSVTCENDAACNSVPGFQGKLRCNTSVIPMKCVFK